MLPTTMNAADFATALSQSKVDTSEANAQGGVAFLTFKGDCGEWLFGADKDDVAGQTGIIQASSYIHGWQLWANSELQEEVTAPFNIQLPDEPEPFLEGKDKRGNDSFKYAEQMRAVNLMLDANDNGDLVPAMYSTCSAGGRKALDGLLNKIKQRAVAGKVEHLNPVIALGSDSYLNKKYGKTIFTPELQVVGWCDDNGIGEDGQPVYGIDESSETNLEIESSSTSDEPPFDAEDEPAPTRRRRRAKA